MVYNILKMLFSLLFATIFRWRVTGTENIPPQGPVIIAPNHISLWDPPLVGCAIPQRKIHFMAKEELFTIPVFNWVIRKLKAFPVRRGMADRNAIRTAVNLLEAGEVVGLFPEGTRSKNGQLGQAELGVAMIAAKTGATIVPTAISGTNAFGKGRIPQFTITFGKPIAVSKGKGGKEFLENLSKSIMAEITRLLAER